MKKYAVVAATFSIATIVVLYLSAFKPASATETVAGPYILVEIYEVPLYENKGIYIHYGGNKTEYIPFHHFKAENHDENGDLILSAVNKLTAQGYEMDKVTSGLAETGMITKMFFRKK